LETFFREIENMNQDFIVLLIIASAISYTIYTFIRGLKAGKKQSGCSGCSGCDLSKNKITCKH